MLSGQHSTGTAEQAGKGDMTQQAEAEGLWDAPIVLAATPIGNLADATDRLKQLISSAEIIACEDTRRTRHLISTLGLRSSATLVSLHEHNEALRSAELIEQARAGARILMVSDAGMPAVSDPGFRLTAAAIDAGVGVTVAPGASAVTTALALSGLPTDRFAFAGFIPRKHSDKQQLILRLRSEDWTTVLFESPHRVAAVTAELAEGLGENRRAAVARELTKKYEEVLRGTLGELAQQLAERAETPGGLKGEFVLVIAGAAAGDREDEPAPTVDELAGVVLERAAAGEKLKTVAKELGTSHGISASELYDAAQKLKQR